MLLIEIPISASLLATTSFLQSSFVNAFIFRSSIEIITLDNLATLFGVCPKGDDVDSSFYIDTSSYNSIILKV